jgi:uridine phosphorylase
MSEDRAIIHPVKGKTTPDPGRRAVLVSTAADLNMLCHAVEVDPRASHRLFTSRLHTGFDARKQPYSLIGPIIGAPYAVMLLETLIVWGARRFIYLGWCGTLAAEVNIGDVVLPAAAAIDEGTSRHYLQEPTGYARPAPPVVAEIRNACRDTKHRFHEGPVWSTDAIFRETRDKVRHYQDQGVLAVEMELSALFTVGKYRGVEVGGILVVSDELTTLTWRPGFKDERFEKGRVAACEAVKQICLKK